MECVVNGVQIPWWVQVAISLSSASAVEAQCLVWIPGNLEKKLWVDLCALFSHVINPYNFLSCVIICFNWNLNKCLKKIFFSFWCSDIIQSQIPGHMSESPLKTFWHSRYSVDSLSTKSLLRPSVGRLDSLPSTTGTQLSFGVSLPSWSGASFRLCIFLFLVPLFTSLYGWIISFSNNQKKGEWKYILRLFLSKISFFHLETSSLMHCFELEIICPQNCEGSGLVSSSLHGCWKVWPFWKLW